MILSRLIGASAAWFLMDFAYYGNTVSSPLVLSALGSDHTSPAEDTYPTRHLRCLRGARLCGRGAYDG
jgi:hypothetical protein